MEHLNIKIYGKVQGIYFRGSAKELADKLGISGYAKNEPDGSISMEVEGEKGAIQEFLAWCKKGPQYAEVRKVETKEGSLQDFKKFSVKF